MEGEVKLRGLGGEALHGLLMTMVRAYSTKDAERLHQAPEPKPFSLSPPLIKGDTTAIFTISLLSDWSVSKVGEAILSAIALMTAFPFSGGKAIISRAEFISPKDIGTTYEELIERAQTENTIGFRFLSPTSFRHRGKQIILPQPELVFQSLLRRWNAFSPIKLATNLKDYFTQILVSRYDLKTELVEFSRFKIIGFKGEVTYSLPKSMKKEIKKELNCLADYAFYAGVGAKTTMGMGQTRRIK